MKTPQKKTAPRRNDDDQPFDVLGTASAAEARTLALVLREMRHAVSIKAQLSIVFDPFVAGGGAHLFAGFSPRGFTREIEGTFFAKRRRGSGR